MNEFVDKSKKKKNWSVKSKNLGSVVQKFYI